MINAAVEAFGDLARPRQQRRHPARPGARQHDRGGVGRGHPRAPQGPLRADPLGGRVLAGAVQGGQGGAGRDRAHVVDVGPARQPRPDELRRGQGRHRLVQRSSRARSCSATACGPTPSRRRPAPGSPRPRPASATSSRRPRTRPSSTCGTRPTSRRWSPTSPTEDCPLTGKTFFVQGGRVPLFQRWTMTETHRAGRPLDGRRARDRDEAVRRLRPWSRRLHRRRRGAGHPVRRRTARSTRARRRIAARLVDRGVRRSSSPAPRARRPRSTRTEQAELLVAVVQAVDGRVPVIAGCPGRRRVGARRVRGQRPGADALLGLSPPIGISTSTTPHLADRRRLPVLGLSLPGGVAARASPSPQLSGSAGRRAQGLERRRRAAARRADGVRPAGVHGPAAWSPAGRWRRRRHPRAGQPRPERAVAAFTGLADPNDAARRHSTLRAQTALSGTLRDKPGRRATSHEGPYGLRGNGSVPLGAWVRHTRLRRPSVGGVSRRCSPAVAGAATLQGSAHCRSPAL